MGYGTPEGGTRCLPRPGDIPEQLMVPPPVLMHVMYDGMSTGAETRAQVLTISDSPKSSIEDARNLLHRNSQESKEVAEPLMPQTSANFLGDEPSTRKVEKTHWPCLE